MTPPPAATLTAGLLHPGAMGVTIGAEAKKSGARVLWATEGRSDATRRRADADGLAPVATLNDLIAASDVILSVCPPHGAEALADAVLAAGFTGLYADLNAIRPERARRIGARVAAAGGLFVDGGIIGPPARTAGVSRLYLSGPRADAETVAALFTGSFHEPVIVSDAPGAASALKMCFAAENKGRIALQTAVRALARAEGAEAALLNEWGMSRPELPDKTTAQARNVAARAWRWTGEMEEIAATFEAAGLPGGFHQGARDLYARMAGFKGAEEPPAFDAVMAAILAGAPRPEDDAEETD